MTKLGKRLIKAADEALAIARGEAEVEHTVTYRGIKIEPTMAVGKRSPTAQAIRDGLLRTKSEHGGEVTDRTAARQLNLFKGKRQRGERVDVGPSEFALQCAVADLLRRWAKPTWIWSALPFGEERPAEFKNGKRVSFAGERLKRMGSQPGWPDLALLGPKDAAHPGIHFLELKRKGGRMSEPQAAFRLWCLLNGVPHAVVYSVAEATAILERWGVWRGKVEVQ